jgi:hypothetical protein
MATITKKAMLMGAALVLAGSVSAYAYPVHGRVVVVPRANVIAPFYDPFWPPYCAPWVYPYAGGRPASDIRVEVEPKQAEVFVDGYYAGLVSDAGHLRVVPGGHAVTLYLEGYRTITENVYVRPGSTFKLRENMERLETGEVSAPAPLPNPGHRGS